MGRELQPTLRFPGFEGEWTTKKMYEISSKIGSGKTPLGGDKVYESNGIPFIRSQNVNNDGLFLDEVYISKEVHSGMLSSSVKPNDILLNITGASIGRSCVVPLDFIEGNVNQHVCIIRLKHDIPKFIQKILASSIGQKLIYQTQTGSGREGLNFESIKGFKLNLPSIPEQQKIADYLFTIDRKISLLEEKKVELTRYKKSMVQKLFSQQIRFKDENGKKFGDWECLEIGKVLTICSGKDYKHLSEGNIPVFGTGGLMKHVNKHLYDGTSVGIGRKGTIDKPVLLKGKFWTVDTLFYTTNFNNTIPEFIYYTFLSINWLEYNEASGVPSLSKGTINKIKISIPSLPEQQKIADFLSTIDDSITKVEEQIQQTKLFKKTMLQQMFV